jgi:hypothetical protein
MRQVTISLPDSVQLTEQEIQALVLAKATVKPPEPASSSDLAMLLGRPVSAEEVADIRHLIALYYAERATAQVDELWDKNDWTADTMQEWLREHMRTSHGRPAA